MLIVKNKQKKLFQIKNTSIYRRAYLERNIELNHENLPFLDDKKLGYSKIHNTKKYWLHVSCLITILLGLRGICPLLWLNDGYV